MTKRRLTLSAISFLAGALSAMHAMAANTTVSIIINSPSSATITCTINYPAGQTSFVEPVAAGAQIASCSVMPGSWSGALTLSGPGAGLFVLSGTNLVVGAAQIVAPGTYSVTITATP